MLSLEDTGCSEFSSFSGSPNEMITLIGTFEEREQP